MKVTTFRDLFWKCILICILINVVFYFVEVLLLDEFYSIYTPSIWVTTEISQILLSFVIGAFIRKKTDYKIFDNDKYKKYIKYIFICMIFSIIILVFPDIIAMPYLFIAKKACEITGHQLFFFSYFDLWSISVCLGCVFFGIQHKKS